MGGLVFLAAAGQGVARATPPASGGWSVEFLLGDQDVRCLAIDPPHPAVVYAGTQGNGVLRSTDGGKTWHPAGLAGRIVKSLAVSGIEPGVVYAGTKPALVFVSRDGGETWAELEAFRGIFSRRFWFSPAEKPYTAYVQALALSPSEPGIVLAGIEAGAVVRSSDGGQTWSGHRRGALRDCHTLAFHPANGSWAYEGGGTGAGVSVSRDAGKTWTQPGVGLDRHYGWAVAADCAHPEVWYASLSPGAMKAHSGHNAQAYVFRSAGGADWQKLAGGLPQPLAAMPYALLADPLLSGHVYAGLGNGDVWHSGDYGDTWRQLPLNLKAMRSMALLAL
jgi:photosystem II stability/assembly factor-like uncharacterized protein